jgi:hypothetical protein
VRAQHSQLAAGQGGEFGELDCKLGHAIPIKPGLQPLSPENGNISNIRRTLSASSVPAGQFRSLETGGEFTEARHWWGFLQALGPFSLTAGLVGWGGRIRTSRWPIGNRTLSLVREEQQNLFPLKFMTNSKRSNFENRTKWIESRASERNGPFGE